MRNSLYIISIILFAALAASCSGSAPDDTIARAEAAVASGDYASARCIEPLASDTTLTPSQLCRIALIYMHMSESDKQRYDDDVTVATQCYMRALHISSDSVETFWQSMPMSELPAMNTLNELACAITSPVDISETAADSIPDIYTPRADE